jgi:hypothetical protein
VAASRSGPHGCMLPGRASGSPTAGRAAPFQLLIARSVPVKRKVITFNTSRPAKIYCSTRQVMQTFQ